MSSACDHYWPGLLGLLLLLNAPDPAAADTAAGHFGPLEIHSRELPLIKSSGELETRFIERGLRLPDPELESWLESVARRLEPEALDTYVDYRFFVIREPTANAFALPDGQIYIHTGLLAVLENEAQLAGILAHEIHHVAGHHGILAQRSQRKKAIASLVVSSLGSLGLFGDFGDLITSATNQYLVLSLLGYSRSLEDEADRRGLRQLLKSGYDVFEMARALERLNRDPEGEQPAIKTKWSTHPDLASRAQKLTVMATALSGRAAASPDVGRDAYRLRTNSVALLTVHDLIRNDQARGAIDLARRLVTENDSDPEALLALGDAMRALGVRSVIAEDQAPTQKTKKKNLKRRLALTRAERQQALLATPEGQAARQLNLQAAEQTYRRALELDPELPAAHRGLGYVYRDLGRPAEAARAFLRYIQLNPSSPERALVFIELKELRNTLEKMGGT